MEENNLKAFSDKISQYFSGPSGIVGERLLQVEEHEQQIKELLVSKFSGFARLLDAFLDFYLESLRLCAKREPGKWLWRNEVLMVVHVASFWRFRASYIIFWKGYYVDAVSLLRAIFENAILMAGIGNKIISVNDIFSGVTNEEIASLPEDIVMKKIRTHQINFDKILFPDIIGKKSGLEEEDQQSLKHFIELMHDAVHKSRTNFNWHLNSWGKGENPLPLLPEISDELAAQYINFSQFVAWMTVRTIGLLQIEKNEFGKDWFDRYKALNDSFKTALEFNEKTLARAVEKLLAAKFSF